MTQESKTSDNLSEREIDRIVVAEADDDAAWEEPVRVRKRLPTSLSIPGDLAARATFLARLHHSRSVEEWLSHVIQERVELEEAAFLEVKQALAARAS